MNDQQDTISKLSRETESLESMSESYDKFLAALTQLEVINNPKSKLLTFLTWPVRDLRRGYLRLKIAYRFLNMPAEFCIDLIRYFVVDPGVAKVIEKGKLEGKFLKSWHLAIVPFVIFSPALMEVVFLLLALACALSLVIFVCAPAIGRASIKHSFNELNVAIAQRNTLRVTEHFDRKKFHDNISQLYGKTCDDALQIIVTELQIHKSQCLAQEECENRINELINAANKGHSECYENRNKLFTQSTANQFIEQEMGFYSRNIPSHGYPIDDIKLIDLDHASISTTLPLPPMTENEEPESARVKLLLRREGLDWVIYGTEKIQP